MRVNTDESKQSSHECKQVCKTGKTGKAYHQCHCMAFYLFPLKTLKTGLLHFEPDINNVLNSSVKKHKYLYTLKVHISAVGVPSA